MVIIKNPLLGRSLTLETLSSGWYCLSSLIRDHIENALFLYTCTAIYGNVETRVTIHFYQLLVC